MIYLFEYHSWIGKYSSQNKDSPEGSPCEANPTIGQTRLNFLELSKELQ